MRTETRRLLEGLEQSDLFSDVGQPFPEEQSESVIAVKSWAVATEMNGSKQWHNTQIHHSNRLLHFIAEKARARSRRWNDHAKEVRADIDLWLPDKLEVVRQKHRLPDSFVNSVSWVVAYACMESEYGDLKPPQFYRRLIDWYLAGRFPCGWGIINDRGRVQLLEPDPDPAEPDPAEPDYLVKAALWPITAATRPLPALPDGRLVVF